MGGKRGSSKRWNRVVRHRLKRYRRSGGDGGGVGGRWFNLRPPKLDV